MAQTISPDIFGGNPPENIRSWIQSCSIV